jgi:hypothetical protein
LALIEALAKIAQAVGEINTNYDPDSLLDALKTVDGAGSGLDADMVDGLHAVDVNALKVNKGSVAYYRNVAHYSNSGDPVVGIMKIALPKLNSRSMMNVTIRGYDYHGAADGTSWMVRTGGYDYLNGVWLNYFARLEGPAPFSVVRLANDGNNSVILLGSVDTEWCHPKVVISDLMVGYSNFDGWDTGWAIEFITDEAGLQNIYTPVVHRLDNEESYGFEYNIEANTSVTIKSDVMLASMLFTAYADDADASRNSGAASLVWNSPQSSTQILENVIDHTSANVLIDANKNLIVENNFNNVLSLTFLLTTQ